MDVGLSPERGHAPARPAAAAGGGKTAPAQAPRLLVVEDDYLVGMEVEASLLDAGYAVLAVVGTAAEAIRLAVSERPYLIVMDVRLAGDDDGVDAAIRIYRETGIRCLFATAHGDTIVQERAEPAAPLGWLAKPYSPDAVVAAIRAALAGPGL